MHFEGRSPLARGGYRRPRNPAPASGPGRYSRRTDGGPKVMDLPNPNYGEGQAFRDAQTSAPMGAPSAPAQSGPPVDLSRIVPFGAPTQRGVEPVTAGAASGPGPGTSALGVADPSAPDPAVQDLIQYLPMLELATQLPNASPLLRQFVRRLRGSS